LRSAVLTAFVFFVVLLGTTVPTPLLALYERSFGVSPLGVTVIFGIYAIGVVACLLTFGHLSDEIGRRPVLATALGLSGLAAIAFLVADSVAVLLPARVVSGLAAALVTGAANAALGEQLPPPRRGLAPVMSVIATMGGLASGTLLAGLLAQWAGYPLRLSWVVDLALVGVGLLALLFVDETVRQRTRPRLRRLRIPAGIRAAFLRVSTPAAAGFGVLGVISATTGVLLAAELHLHDPAVTGVVLFLAFASTAVGQLLDHRLPPAVSPLAACVALIVSACLIAAAVLVPSLAALIVAAVVAGLGTGTGLSAGLRLIGSHVPEEQRGAAFSLYFVMLYSALALPAVGVGLLTELAGLRWAGTLFAVALAVVSLAAFVGLRTMRPVADHPGG
jgi:MFS family permease